MDNHGLNVTNPHSDESRIQLLEWNTLRFNIHLEAH